jgi:hypothetical protein
MSTLQSTRLTRMVGKALVTAPVMAFAAMAIVVPLKSLGQCYGLTTSQNNTTNVANHGSPFLYYANNEVVMVYQDHNSNQIYTNAPSNSSSGPTSTGLTGSTAALEDVTAARLQTSYYIIAFLGTSNTFQLSQSANGINSFGAQYSFSISGAPTLNGVFIPYLYSFGDYVYAAYVSSNNYVYLARTTDGHTWTQLGEVSTSFQTISRPTLAAFNGNLYIAYVGSDHGVFAGTVIVNGSFVPNVVTQPGELSNSNYDGGFAGVAMQQIGSTLWMFAQSIGSGNELYEATSTNGENFGAPFACELNLRFTPSVYLDSTGTLHSAWQQNQNTQIATGQS